MSLSQLEQSSGHGRRVSRRALAAAASSRDPRENVRRHQHSQSPRLLALHEMLRTQHAPALRTLPYTAVLDQRQQVIPEGVDTLMAGCRGHRLGLGSCS